MKVVAWLQLHALSAHGVTRCCVLCVSCAAGLPGTPGDPASVMAMMSNMQAMFQAQQAATAAAMPTNSGGGSTGGILSPQQQQQQHAQQPPPAGAVTAGLPTPAAAVSLPGMVQGMVSGSIPVKQEVNGMLGAQLPGMAGANMAAAMHHTAAAGMQPPAAAAVQHAAAMPGSTMPMAAAQAGVAGSEFRNVFDDVFDGPGAHPAAPAVAAGGRGTDEEFLDFILKV